MAPIITLSTAKPRGGMRVVQEVPAVMLSDFAAQGEVQQIASEASPGTS
jgi:hypothetical protein